MSIRDLLGGVFRNFSPKFAGGTLQNAHPKYKPLCDKFGPRNPLGYNYPLGGTTKCTNAGIIPPPTPASGIAPAGVKQPSVTKLFTVNPISVPSAPATKLMLANPNRTRWSVTNVSTDIIFLGLGKIPTAVSYDHVLPACVTSANDGSGGVIVDEDWQGEIWAIGLNGGTVAITEDP